MRAQCPGQPSAVGVGVDFETVACCEPPAQLFGHKTLHRETAWVGRSHNRPVWQLENCEARFKLGISVALRAVEGVEHPPHISADKRRQNGGGEAVEIGA